MADQTPKQKRLWTIMLIPLWITLALLPVFSIVIPMCVLQRTRLKTLEENIAIELGNIRAVGDPATLEELDKWYAYPDGPNAADVYAKAFEKFSKDDGKWNDIPGISYEAKLPKLGEPLPEKMKKRIAAFLADNAEAIKLLHEAAGIEGCRFPVRFVDASNPSEFRLPHSEPLRAGVRHLQLAAVMAAETGRAEEAASHIGACIGIVRSLRNEPYGISQLVRMSCLAVTKNALEQVMARVRLSGSQRAALAAGLQAEERTETSGRAAVGERCITDRYFLPGGAMFGEASEDDTSGETFWHMSGVVSKGRLFCLKWLGRAVRVARLPLNERLEASRRFSAELEAETEIDVMDFLSQDFMGKFMLGMTAPGCTGEIAEDLTGFATLRSMRTALAIEGFREAQKRLPESLAELVPKYLKAIPLDPFDGKPLRFKKREKGYVVYSIGEDGTDDDGIGPPKSSGPIDDGLDVPFRVVR